MLSSSWLIALGFLSLMTGDDTAIDAATNRVKDDKSAAEWLPKRNPQTSAGSSPGRGTITTRYHLAVTQDEKDEMIRGLSSGLCDGSRLKPLPPSEFKAPESKPIGEPKPSPKPELQPSPKPTPSQILSRRGTQSRTTGTARL